MLLETTTLNVEPFTFNEALDYINKHFRRVKRPEIQKGHLYNLVSKLEVKTVRHKKQTKAIKFNDIVLIANHCINSSKLKYTKTGRKPNANN